MSTAAERVAALLQRFFDWFDGKLGRTKKRNVYSTGEFNYPPKTGLLCDSCKYNYGNVCFRPERPNATKCPDYKEKGIAE